MRLFKNWKETDVYSCDKYLFSLNLYAMISLKTILFFCFRTSVLPSSHVESSFISDKISRSCFFGSVIQLAKFTSYDVVVALTCEFAVAKHQTFVRILYPFWFKDVTFESFSWGTGSNPVEACTLLGAFAIIAKIDCPPVRIKSLVEFHPRVKWNLFLQRKIVIRLPNILYLPYSIARRAWETRGKHSFFYLFVFSGTIFSPSPPLCYHCEKKRKCLYRESKAHC